MAAVVFVLPSPGMLIVVAFLETALAAVVGEADEVNWGGDALVVLASMDEATAK